MWNKSLCLTDNQIKDIFDNCRNLGICGAFFAASDWELAHIGVINSLTGVFNSFVFVLLMMVGTWLYVLTHLQAFRKFSENGFTGIKLTISRYAYSVMAVSLLGSIFLH